MTGGGAERSREVRDPQGGAPGRFRGQEIAQARDDREPEPGVAPTDASDGLGDAGHRSEEHTSELQSLTNLVCRLLLEKKKKTKTTMTTTTYIKTRQSN